MRKKSGLLKALLALIFLATGCVSKNAQLYEEAQSLWLAGRHQEAISKLIVVVEGEKRGKLRIKALFRLGEIYYLNVNEPKKALEYFLQVANESAGNETGLASHKYIADIYMNGMGEHELAILQYQRIMSDYKELVEEDEYYYLVAMAYYKSSDYAQAIIEFQTFLENYPNSKLAFDARLQVANCLFISGKTKEALDLFLKLHLEAPEGRYDYDLRFVIALCYEELDKLDLALAEYNSLSERYPERKLLEKKKAAVEKRLKKKVEKKSGKG